VYGLAAKTSQIIYKFNENSLGARGTSKTESMEKTASSGCLVQRSLSGSFVGPQTKTVRGRGGGGVDSTALTAHPITGGAHIRHLPTGESFLGVKRERVLNAMGAYI